MFHFRLKAESEIKKTISGNMAKSSPELENANKLHQPQRNRWDFQWDFCSYKIRSIQTVSISIDFELLLH